MEKSLKNKVIGILRSASVRWPEKSEAKKRARVDRGQYKCNLCGGFFKDKEIQMDHINPVIDPYKGWESFDVFIEKLFCSADKYQALCFLCHDAKSKVEDEIRKMMTEKKNNEKKELKKLEKQIQKEAKKNGISKKTT